MDIKKLFGLDLPARLARAERDEQRAWDRHMAAWAEVTKAAARVARLRGRINQSSGKETA